MNQPIQALLILIFLIAISKVFMRYRSEDLSLKETVVWILFWVLAGVVVIQPNLTARVAEMLGVGRGADVVVYISLVVLFFIVFRLVIKIEKLNREITKVIREKALK
ncbi:MAG: DUF2304 family protein [Patescibacteria group bacterium]|jgi:hypothetical protein